MQFSSVCGLRVARTISISIFMDLDPNTVIKLPLEIYLMLPASSFGEYRFLINAQKLMNLFDSFLNIEFQEHSVVIENSRTKIF